MNSKTWKPVKGYEEFYEVSSCGIVRSLTKKTIVKSYTPEGEYEMVSLRVNKNL